MKFLIDHNIQGQALILFSAIASQGWLDLVSIQFITFADIELPIDSSDRIVWQLAQKKEMILLTANRSMNDKDSLEQVMREENTFNSLPVITIANPDLLLNSAKYRQRCLESLIDIVIDIDNYRGSMRLFIP